MRVVVSGAPVFGFLEQDFTQGFVGGIFERVLDVHGVMVFVFSGLSSGSLEIFEWVNEIRFILGIFEGGVSRGIKTLAR